MVRRRDKKSSSRERRAGDKQRGGRSSSRSSKRRYQKDALMNRMKQSQQQAEGGRGIIKSDAEVTLWRPGGGTHMIDIIPYAVGKNNVDGDEPGAVHYTFRYFLHRRVGPANNLVICPLKTWGKDCPICEERQRLYDSGQYTEKEDWEKHIKPLGASERYIYNIVCYDRGEEKKGVQIWDVSNHYFQKHIITLSKKPRRGGRGEKNVLFFDEDEGKTISFTVEPKKGQDDYDEYVGHAFEERDYTIPDDILDSVHCLDEIVEIKTYDEIEKLFYGRDGKETSRSGDSGRSRSDRSDDSGGDDSTTRIDDLLDMLDDLENNKELQEFCDDNDIDVRLKGGRRFFEKNMEAVREFIEDMEDDGDDGDGDSGDGDSGGDSDYTEEEIEDMSKRELKQLIKDESLDIDPRDFKEVDDLRDEIIDQLGIDDVPY